MYACAVCSKAYCSGIAKNDDISGSFWRTCIDRIAVDTGTDDVVARKKVIHDEDV